jgi:hypothetical protein
MLYLMLYMVQLDTQYTQIFLLSMSYLMLFYCIKNLAKLRGAKLDTQCVQNSLLYFMYFFGKKTTSPRFVAANWTPNIYRSFCLFYVK